MLMLDKWVDDELAVVGKDLLMSLIHDMNEPKISLIGWNRVRMILVYPMEVHFFIKYLW